MSHASPFLQAAAISMNTIGLWDAYLLLRQRRSYNTKEVPGYFKAEIGQGEFDKTQAYGRERTSYSLFEHVKGLVVGNLELVLKVPAWLYYFVAKKANLTVGSFAHNYTYAIAADVISTAMEIPFSYYETFHIEERHGFNKTTKTEFVKDIVKSFLLRAALLYPMQIALVQFVVRKFGERFPLYLFAGISGLVFLFLLIFPTFIQPLFNTFTPLDKDSALLQKIEKLSASMHFPLKKVFVVDGSRRSHHSNAYFYGFGSNKRIVLYDTLLEQMKGEDERVLAVLCHELGHWKHGHMYVNVGIALAQVFVICFGAGAVLFNRKIYEAFGFREVDPVVGLNIFMEAIFKPIGAVVEHTFCYISRHNEFQADEFAVQQGYGEELKKALMVTTKENKGSITPDPLYSAMTYTHPPMLERLQAIDEQIKKTK